MTHEYHADRRSFLKAGATASVAIVAAALSLASKADAATRQC